ncbi:CaiB/BaiF CoA transferase family protein [Rhodococcus erythropolis]|uniref:CaiB/BaiF CoA transferase family protein n=1 Tax=Rhodococcus erythropolis TaxID=1833 RepID=UPI002226CEDD|nr:CaiB/BaiF CoA-transferase family protein [Rhodococcus erythropolis]MCW2295432.1 crotonobetainyl-CoA:carnitine CoA-transferase CaiB-like acyl-CoA transferase [Rhodococcus erythropolis]
MLPLSGITVVSLEQAVAAPFATRQLADLGARVIKIERPGVGDFARQYDETVMGQSSHFVWLNRSKESLELDLKDPADLDVLLTLVDSADVFVQNLAPGAADRLGLSAKTLRASNPGLVHASISGYGDGGPFTRKKAYDLLVQCEAGLVSVTGTPEMPAKTGISTADIAAGMYCYSGILTALFQRERTGEGSEMTVSMLEALGEWMGFPMYYATYGGTPPPRSGASHASIAPYGPFRCAAGQQVFLGVQNEREWNKFCANVLGDEALAADERFVMGSQRVAHREALTELIEKEFASLDADEVLERLEAAGIANARLRDLHEFADHPQLSARNRWREVPTPAGNIRALLPPVSVAGQEPFMGAVPALGQHNDAIRADLADRNRKS